MMNKELPAGTMINLDNVRVFFFKGQRFDFVVGVRNNDKTKIVPIDDFAKQNRDEICDIRKVHLLGEYDSFYDNFFDFFNSKAYLKNEEFAQFYAKCIQQNFEGKMPLGKLQEINNAIQRTQKEEQQKRFDEDLLKF